MKRTRRHEYHSNLSLVGEDGEHFINVLQRLMESLEPFQAEIPEMHQLYLETQWLLSNQRHGMLILPNNWNLIVFDLIKRDALKKYPQAHKAALQLVNIINSLASMDEDLKEA